MENLQQNTPRNQDSSYPSQPLTWQPQPYDTSVGPHKRQPKLKSVGIGLLVFTLVAIAIGVLVYLRFFTTPKADYTGAIKAVQESIQTNGRLMNDDLQAIDRTNLFLAGMYSTSRQPIQHLISAHDSLDPAKSLKGKELYPKHVFDATFNYSSKELNLTHQVLAVANDTTLSFNRCVDGQQYSFYDIKVRNNVTWQSDGSDNDYCDVSKTGARLGINDGLNSGGLSQEQADKFMQAIFNQTGLVQVDDVSLVTRDSKDYIKIKARIAPVQKVINNKTSYHGTQALMWAFNETGLDSLKHPYSIYGINSTSMHITEYLDPATMLPAYAEYAKDTGLDDKGKPRTWSVDNTYDLHRVQYDFGGSVSRGSVDAAPTPILLSWPAEKR